MTYIPSVCTHAVPGAATNKAGLALGTGSGNFDADGNTVDVHAAARGVHAPYHMQLELAS